MYFIYSMEPSTLLIFYLPIFVLTYVAYMGLSNINKKRKYTYALEITLKIVRFFVALLLLYELIFWFILPAYNYAF